jgi:protein-tyrosine phosphatase
MMRAFEGASQAPSVPDAYYGGASGFEDAYQMLILNAQGLLQYLQQFKQQNLC